MSNLKNYKNLIILGFDLSLIIFSYIFSCFLRFDFKLPEGYLESIFPKILIPLAIYFLTFLIFGLYKTIWTVAGVYDYSNIVIANLISTSSTLIINTFLPNRIPYSIIIMASTLILLGTLSARMMFRIYRSMFLNGNIIVKNSHRKSIEKLKNILIIGAGTSASMLIKEIRNHPQLNLNIIGLIDDDDHKQKSKVSGYKVLGKTDDISEISEKYKIEEIIIAIPSADHIAKKEILEKAKKTKAKLRTLPGMYEILSEGLSLKSIRDVDVLDLLGRKEIKLNNEEINAYIQNKTVMVTGGGGSIGSELCRQIAKLSPQKLIILDIYENNAYEIQNELLRKNPGINLEVLIASVRDKKKITQIFKEYKPEVIFHAAAHKHVPLMEKSPEEAIKNNVFGTYNVAEAAKKYKAEKFILISTDKAVNPTNIMGASKRLCEMVIQMMDIESEYTDFVAVRFGNVLGSNGSVIPLFKKQIEEGGPVTLTHKDITRFFMTIPEAVQLVMQAGSYAKGGEIFVLDMGEPVKIYDLAENLIKLSGFEPNKEIEIKVIGLRPGEKLYEELLMEEEGLKDTPNSRIFVGRPNGFKIDQLKIHLETLNKMLEDETSMPEDIVIKMKEVVTTYKTELQEKAIQESNL